VAASGRPHKIVTKVKWLTEEETLNQVPSSQMKLSSLEVRSVIRQGQQLTQANLKLKSDYYAGKSAGSKKVSSGGVPSSTHANAGAA